MKKTNGKGIWGITTWKDFEIKFLVQDLLNIFNRQKDAGVHKLRVYH